MMDTIRTLAWLLAAAAAAAHPVPAEPTCPDGKTPLAGRWPTASCATTPLCSSRDELGWLDPANARFVLCDLHCQADSCWLSDCVAYATPFDPCGHLPLVGDWNHDGWDEVGLHHPATGASYRFALTTDCPEPGQGCLDLVESAFLGGAGELPLIGSWQKKAPDAPGFFDPASGLFQLDPDGGGYHHLFALAAPHPQTTPLAGDWDADGVDTAGLYRHDLQRLTYVDVHAAGPQSIFLPRLDGGAGFSAASLPFSGRWGLARRFGIYDPEAQPVAHFYLFDLTPGSRGPIFVSIPKDPGTKDDPEQPDQ